jgi:hypothetical protein
MSSGQVADLRRCAADPSDLLLAIKELLTFTLACADRQTNSFLPAMRRRSQMPLDIRISRARVTLIKPIDLSYEC